MFYPSITIEADVHRFTFRKGDQQWNCSPFLYLTQDSKIQSIGEHPTDQGSFQFVHLFEEPISPIDYSEVLAAFFRHGIFCVSKKRTMLRPKIHIIASRSVVTYLRGFSKLILSRAALEAGATSVVIEEQA